MFKFSTIIKCIFTIIKCISFCFYLLGSLEGGETSQKRRKKQKGNNFRAPPAESKIRVFLWRTAIGALLVSQVLTVIMP